MHTPRLPRFAKRNQATGLILTFLTRDVQQTPRRTRDDPPVEHPTEALRVLVVDDEPSIIDVVSMALRHHGYDVATAAGQAASRR